MKKDDIVVIIKLSDDVFNGFHPNGIDKGYTKVGKLYEDLQVGKRCIVINDKFGSYLSTSTVVEIVDEHTFKTENSTYSIYPYEMKDD